MVSDVRRLARLERALLSYVLTVRHLKRVANPEDWSTYGDWDTLERAGLRALDRSHDLTPNETRETTP